MMRIRFLSLFPDFFESPCSMGVIAGALEKELLKIECVDLRNYSKNKHKKCDDYSYGGGPGMLMSVEPFKEYFESNPKEEDEHVILFTPTGTPLSQHRVSELSKKKKLSFICGHYEGIDSRVEKLYADEAISVGDFVLSGGEFAALTLTDAISRYLGVLGNDESVESDSFEKNACNLLEYEQFTRPREIMSLYVPDDLLTGNHGVIEKWRRKSALERTFEYRSDMFAKADLNAVDILTIFEYLKKKERNDG